MRRSQKVTNQKPVGDPAHTSASKAPSTYNRSGLNQGTWVDEKKKASNSIVQVQVEASKTDGCGEKKRKTKVGITLTLRVPDSLWPHWGFFSPVFLVQKTTLVCFLIFHCIPSPVSFTIMNIPPINSKMDSVEKE